jgi:hypothetical protein
VAEKLAQQVKLWLARGSGKTAKSKAGKTLADHKSAKH